MNKVINAEELFKSNNTIYYCTEFDGYAETIPSKQIALYDLDKNGELRVCQLNGDPLYSNLHFNFSEIEHTRYNAFYTLEEALKYSDEVLKVTMDNTYFKVVDREVITPVAKAVNK